MGPSVVRNGQAMLPNRSGQRMLPNFLQSKLPDTICLPKPIIGQRMVAIHREKCENIARSQAHLMPVKNESNASHAIRDPILSKFRPGF